VVLTRLTDADGMRCPDPSPATRPVPKDVYAWSNAGQRVVLCLSCAAKRRRKGVVVEMVGERAVAGRCEDCGK
jgi:hypothetical protein